jgi:hypothetical protein
MTREIVSQERANEMSEREFFHSWFTAIHQQNEEQIKHLRSTASVMNAIGLLLILGILVQGCSLIGLI